MKTETSPRPAARRDQLAPWLLFLQAHSVLVERLEHELKEAHALPLTWYEVLLRLATSTDGRMRMSDLAGSLLLSKSGVTRLIDRMEEAGLVSRGSCPSDRRGSLAVLTSAGRAAYEAAAPLHLDGIERHFLGRLSKTERKALTSAFEKVLEPAPTTRSA